MLTRQIIDHINRFGIDASEELLAVLAHAASDAGVASPSLSLLTDPSAAPVLRERAAAHIALLMGRGVATAAARPAPAGAARPVAADDRVGRLTAGVPCTSAGEPRA